MEREGRPCVGKSDDWGVARAWTPQWEVVVGGRQSAEAEVSPEPWDCSNGTTDGDQGSPL